MSSSIYSHCHLKFFMTFLILALLSTLTHFGDAEKGPCRFDVGWCSCSDKAQGGGTCWTREPNGKCTSRKCKGGWSCLCVGRTHLCKTEERQVLVGTTEALASLPGQVMTSVQCSMKTRNLVTSPELRLGSLLISISQKGVLANNCNEFAWYLNGEQMGFYPSLPEVSTATVNDAQLERGYHSLLELRDGDIIAFRFRKASYYCFTGLVDINHNSSISQLIPDTDVIKQFQAYYTRYFIEGWNSRDLVLNDTNTAANEVSASTKGGKRFVLLRSRRLSGEALSGFEDAWEPFKDGNADTAQADWYFRLKIPKAAKAT